MSDLKVLQALQAHERIVLTFSDGAGFDYDPALDAYPVAIRVERTVEYAPEGGDAARASAR